METADEETFWRGARGSLTYRRFLDRQLRPRLKRPGQPVAIEIYAGCGGMALGFAAAGFHTIGYERDRDARDTYCLNLPGHCHLTELTTASNTDVGNVLVAGPPCQPFSVTGQNRGPTDPRNGLPTFLAAVKRTRPAVAVLENVPALKLRHEDYFAGLIRKMKRLGYSVDSQILNAADFGVPQNRRRLFVVAHRGGFEFPRPTHAGDPVTVRQALGSMVGRLPVSAALLSRRTLTYVARYEKKCQCRKPRDLDVTLPSRTLTCRNLAAWTGDMVRLKMPNGQRRLLTVREAARLQSFPDWFRFEGSQTSKLRQIGNAVPPLLAKVVAVAVMACLEQAEPT